MITRGITSIAGRPVDMGRLVAGNMEVNLLSFGATTRDWKIGGRSVILGYDDPAEYGDDPFYLGIIAGRVANRIAGSRFTLAGEEVVLDANIGPNHLHGGPRGLGKRFWQMEADSAGNALRLSYVSGHGDGGYPGRASFEVVVSLTDTRLSYEMRATVDRPTPIALAQHNYYTLTGGTIWDHILAVPAAEYLDVDEGLIPTGARSPVDGTALDFRVPRPIGDAAPNREVLDSCLVLDGSEPVAELTAPGAPTLRFYSNQPGLQVYNGAYLDHPFAPFTGLCLEPEAFPDAVNHPGFPSMIVTPDAPYLQTLSIEVV